MVNKIFQCIMKRIENPGVISAQTMKSELALFLSECGCSKNDLFQFFKKANKTLGLFSSLPQKLQAALTNAAEYHYREKERDHINVDEESLLKYFFQFAGFLMHIGWIFKLKGGDNCFVGKCRFKDGFFCWVGISLYRAGRVIHRFLLHTNKILLEKRNKLESPKLPFLYALWKFIEIDIDDIIVNYIENIGINPKLNQLFKNDNSKFESCALIGFDLLSSDNKLYFIESNFNAGFGLYRLGIYTDGDPVCINIVNYASEKGYENIIINPSSCYTLFHMELEKSWKYIAEKKGISLSIIDDFNFKSPYKRSSDYYMNIKDKNTLYVNGRYIKSPLGDLIAIKGNLEEEFEKYNKHVSNNDPILYPKRIKFDNDIKGFARENKFPNIILKDSLIDMANGIELYKSEKLPTYANKGSILAYEFVQPDCIRHGSKQNEYVFLYRAYLLLTADGPHFLGARKDISAIPVPKELPVGKVQYIEPYITNLHLGDSANKPSVEEDLACKNAILRYGAVLYDYCKRKYKNLN